MLNQALQLRQEMLNIFQDRFHAGFASELDVSRIQTEVSSAKANLADAKRRRAEFQNALAVLCGKSPTNFEIAPAEISWIPPQIAPGLPSELLERRPDVAEAERRLAACNAEIGVAQAAFFPSIHLTASGGFQSVELEDIFTWENRVWSFGPSISLPIFSGGRNAANLEAAKAAYEEAVARYRQSILVAFREVDDALAAIHFLEEQVVLQQEAVQFANRSSEISNTHYQNGVSDYLDFIDAERTRLSNELQVLKIKNQRMIATIKLIKAIGGGWSQEIKEEDL
jgi:multidrug efflux system outer membrane protein